MATQPEQKHLQSLKFIVDTAKTSHRNTIWEAFLAWEKIIKFPQWMAALQYTERRLGSMETEVAILAERLREVAKFVKDKEKDENEKVVGEREKDVSVITTAQAKDRRARASLELEGLDREKLRKEKVLERVLNALRDATVAYTDKKNERARCEQALEKWLGEGKDDGTINIAFMEGIPIVTLQTLKALVDTASDSFDAALHFAFDPSAHPLYPETWQEILMYIYSRLTPIEAELTLLYPRAQELSLLVGRDMSHILAVEPVERPPETEELYIQLTVDDVPHLKDLVIRGIGLLREKEHQRRTYYAVIKFWIMEGWNLKTI